MMMTTMLLLLLLLLGPSRNQPVAEALPPQLVGRQILALHVRMTVCSHVSRVHVPPMVLPGLHFMPCELVSSPSQTVRRVHPRASFALHCGSC